LIGGFPAAGQPSQTHFGANNSIRFVSLSQIDLNRILVARIYADSEW
jgi:hypothetical protein